LTLQFDESGIAMDVCYDLRSIGVDKTRLDYAAEIRPKGIVMKLFTVLFSNLFELRNRKILTNLQTLAEGL
jgi:hypothetical protein